MSKFAGQSSVCCEWPIISFDKITGFLRHGNFGLDFTEQFNIVQRLIFTPSNSSSVHNCAHLRLGSKKFKYINPFSYLRVLLIPVVSCSCSKTCHNTTAGPIPLILKIHLSAFVLLEFFCKCRLRDKYIFLPELAQSSQYFPPFLSAHQAEQGRKQAFEKFVRHFKLVVQVDWVLGLNLTSVNLLQVLQLADVWKSTAKYKNEPNKRKREKHREKSSFSSADRSYDLFILCRLRWTT